jgi:hypothetical protein
MGIENMVHGAQASQKKSLTPQHLFWSTQYAEQSTYWLLQFWKLRIRANPALEGELAPLAAPPKDQIADKARHESLWPNTAFVKERPPPPFPSRF